MQHVWEREDVHTEFWWGNVMGRDYLEIPGVDGMVLRWIFRKWVERGMNWINVAQDWNRWLRALVYAVIDFVFHKMRVIYCPAENRVLKVCAEWQIFEIKNLFHHSVFMSLFH